MGRNVQVTLQILRALLDKSPRDISLYAQYLLRILTLVLNSRDISMVEESVPTFETFCQHQDHATLTTDQELARLYDGVIKSYASFAEKAPTTGKTLTAPIATRWKSAGLQALKSISATDTMAVDGGRQLAIIIPALLRNIYSEDDKVLLSLYHKLGLEIEALPRRRGSVSLSIARASAQIERPNPILSDTTAGADREAAEEAAMIAMQSLKQIFSAHNRAQIRLATSNVLNFLAGNTIFDRPGTAASVKPAPRMDWPITLIELIATWTPVQDRFVIVVTAMERLIRYLPSEENLTKQLSIARLVQHLLGSSINMIGLSVMDILLGLVQQILVVLQVSSSTSHSLPVHQRVSAIDLFPETPEQELDSTHTQQVVEPPAEPSATRQELLKCLENCIANLATHIYYSDQISDILTAILSRLKPSISSGVTNPTAAVENPAAAVQAIAESGNLKEDPNTDDFFSFGTARVIALNAVKQVLTIANRRSSTVGTGAIGRNKVTIRVWEGTQWLLRDEDRRVRRAYIGALLTWLTTEMDKKDLRIVEDILSSKKNKVAGEEIPRTASSIARVASNASRGSRVNSLKTTYLQLIHLAVYDNVLESPEDKNDILLMHLLLTSLGERLGMNALRSGLPMVLRLQEDINTTAACKTPKAKIYVGSLVHGYLLSLSRIFEFETTMPGFEIGNEISRRKKARLWLDSIQVPPLSLEKIAGASVSYGALPDDIVKNESLKPFDDIQAMINQISIGYSNQLASPPQSPPQSPNRGISTMSSSITLAYKSDAEELPQFFREELMTRWSKEMCIASIEKEAKNSSPHGSRSGTTYSTNNGFLSATPRSIREQPTAFLGVTSESKGALGSLAIVTAGKKHKSASANGSGPPTPISGIESRTLRMDDLKRVLAGHSMADATGDYNRKSSSIRGGSPLRTSTTTNNFSHLHGTINQPSIISTGSDSIVDAEGFESATEGDLDHPLPTPQSPITEQELQNMQIINSTVQSPSSLRPRSNSSVSAENPEANAKALRGDIVPPIIAANFGNSDEVPPVPPLPEGIKRASKSSTYHATTTAIGGAVGSTVAPGVLPQLRDRSTGRYSLGNRRSVPPILKNSTRIMSETSSVASDRRSLAQSLLNSIEVDDQDTETIPGRPPY